MEADNMDIRDLIEGKDFYRKRQYKSSFYQIPLPYRTLSEYELWECDMKAFESVGNKDVLMSFDENTKLTPEQSMMLARATKLTDYLIVLAAMKDFVDGLTIELVFRMKGVPAFATLIRKESGVGSEEEIKNF